MGGKKGGGSAHVPYEAPNTLYSKQQVKVLDVLSEGPVEGLSNGNAHPFKSIFFDDTPVQAKDGSYNFFGFNLVMTTGEKDQTYLPGFDVVEKTRQVNADVKRDTPITRSITDSNVSSTRVTVGVKGLVQSKDNGDRVATSVSMQASLLKNGNIHSSRAVTINEKGTESFYQDVTFEDLPEAPFDVRVTRLTADSNSDKLQNATIFPSFVESIDAKLSYKYLAMAGYKFDAMQFGSSLPRINTLMKLLIVSVPSNYDPINRKYVGMWDGSFKKAWTDNPAWVIYDFATNKRYGGALDPRYINRAALYRLSQFCDELVDDGYGGKEPRVRFNAFYTSAKKFDERLQDMASSCFGLAHWDGQHLTFSLDRDDDPVAVYTNANVIDGNFSYEGISHNAIVTDVHVQYNDAKDAYRQKVEVVEDIDLLRRYPRNTKKVVAEGCTGKSQAHRMGRYILEKSRLQKLVSFTVGREGLRHRPHDVIQIADIHAAGANIGGRILEVNGNAVTLDREVEKVKGSVFSYVGEKDGKLVRIETAVVSQKDDFTLILKDVTDDIKEYTVFNIARTDVKPKYYRALGISDNGDGTYSIKAVEHEMGLQDRIASGIKFEDNPNSIWTSYPEITNGTVGNNGDEVVIAWDNINADTTSLTYTVKLFKDGKIFKIYPDLSEPVLRFDNLPSGTYVAEIQAKNSRGQLSNILKQYFDLNFTITELMTHSEVFGVKVAWKLPTIINTAVSTEIWRSETNDINDARLYVTLPYPISEYDDKTMSIGEEYYYFLRIIDKNETTGEFTRSMHGKPSQNIDKIKDYFEGQITTKELSSEVIAEILNKTIDGIKDDVDQIISESDVISELNKQIGDAELEQRLLELSKSSGDGAIFAETQVNRLSIDNAYSEIILQKVSQATSDKQLASQYLSLLVENERAKAELMLSQIAQTTDSKALVQEISSLTASFLLNTASIDSLKVATTTEFEATTKNLEQLNSKVGNNTSSINSLQTTVSNNQQSTSKEISNLRSDVGKNSAGVNTNKLAIANVDGYVSSQYTLTTETTINGEKYVSGFTSKQDGKTSEFVVQADKFAIMNKRNGEMQTPFIIASNKMFFNGDMIATGSISGDKLVANTSIQTPIIKGGRIESGHIAGGSINIGNGNFSVDSNGNLIAKSGRFEGTVYADRIEGDVIKRVTVPNFNVIANRETHINGLTLNCKEIIIPPANFDRYFTIDSLRVSGGGDPRAVGMWQITIDDSPLYLNKRNAFSPFEVLTPGTGFIVKKGVVAIMSFVYSTNYQGSAPSLRISNLSLSYSKVDSMETIRVTDGSRYYGRSDTNNNTSITIGES